jgi:hypothetical protein
MRVSPEAKPLPKLVLVEWEDSAQPSPGWAFLENAPALDVVRCVSVGWLVGRSERVTMLAPNIGDIESEGGAQGSGYIRIPTSCVTRTVDLVEAPTRPARARK